MGLRDFSKKCLTKELASGIIDLSKEREVDKMKIIKKAKKTRRLEDFRPGEVFQGIMGGDLFMKVDDTSNEDSEDCVVVNLISGKLCFFDYDYEFIPIDCAIVMEE